MMPCCLQYLFSYCSSEFEYINGICIACRKCHGMFIQHSNVKSSDEKKQFYRSKKHCRQESIKKKGSKKWQPSTLAGIHPFVLHFIPWMFNNLAPSYKEAVFVRFLFKGNAPPAHAHFAVRYTKCERGGSVAQKSLVKCWKRFTLTYPRPGDFRTLYLEASKHSKCKIKQQVAENWLQSNPCLRPS